MKRVYLCVHGEGVPAPETEHIAPYLTIHDRVSPMFDLMTPTSNFSPMFALLLVYFLVFTCHSMDLSTAAGEHPPSRTSRECSRRPPHVSPSSPCHIVFSTYTQQRCENHDCNAKAWTVEVLLCARLLRTCVPVSLCAFFSSIPVVRTS